MVSRIGHPTICRQDLQLSQKQTSRSLNLISRGRVLIVWDDLLSGEQLFRHLKPCLCHSVQFDDVLPPRTLSHRDTLVGELLALQGC